MTLLGRLSDEEVREEYRRALAALCLVVAVALGAFPFWLAPVQVRIVPVGEDHRAAAEEVRGALAEAGFRVDVDERDETVGRRIRDAELEKIPKVIVYGDRESTESLSVRDRGGEQYRIGLVDFVRDLAKLSA